MSDVAATIERALAAETERRRVDIARDGAMKRDDQSDVPNVCMVSEIARKHARQLVYYKKFVRDMDSVDTEIERKHVAAMARRRVRTCEEIRGEVERENERHICNKIEEVGRHKSQIKALLDELKRVGG